MKFSRFQTDAEATAIYMLLAQSRIFIKPFMDMMCVQSFNTSTILACYKLGYMDDVVSAFLHRVRPKFKESMEVLSLKEMYRTIVETMGIIVCQKHVTTFNQ